MRSALKKKSIEGDEMMDGDEGFFEEEEVQEPEEQRFSRRKQSTKVIGMPNSAAKMRMLVSSHAATKKRKPLLTT